MLRMTTAMMLAAALSACGNGSSDGGDSGITFELPQILPDNNPICMNYMPVRAGANMQQNVLLQDLGKQALVISGAEMINDARSSFSVVGVNANGVAGPPTTVESKEFAVAAFKYAPTAPGWDVAALRITSNAENYPTLDIYIIARADSMDGSPFDPGPRPALARDACPERDAQ